MALIKCIECGHEVSDKASMCPKCGCPVEFNEEDTPKVSENVKSNIIITNDSKASTMVPSSSKSTKVFWKNKNHLIFLTLLIIAVTVITFLIYTSLSSTNKQEMMEAVAEAEVEKRGMDLQKPFATKKVEYQKETSEVKVEVEFDYPSSGSMLLVESIRGYIAEVLNMHFWWSDKYTKPKYNGDMADGQALANYIGQYKVKTLTQEHQEDEWSTSYYDEEISIKKLCETDNYITYETSMWGSHGGVGWVEVFGQTFSKNDGHKVKILKNTKSNDFMQLLIQTVVNEVGGSEGLNDSFFQSPMSEAEPYLVNGAVKFVYQKYEIGPGVLGAPQILMYKKDILPYLTDEAKELLEDEVKIRSCSLNGTISQYKIHMDVTINGNEVWGTYSYDSQPKDKKMTVKGTIDNNNTMYLSEYDPGGDETGCFNGNFDGSTYEGVFSNYSRNSNLNFYLETQ